MSAAVRREELEAAIWSAARDLGACRKPGPCTACATSVDTVLAIADEYAAASVAAALDARERTARAITAAYIADGRRQAAEGRARLELAAAEHDGRPA